MPILARCPVPECGQAVKVRDEFAGKKVRCPKCQGAIPIPTAQPAASQPDDPPAAKATTKPVPAVSKAAQQETDDFEVDLRLAKKSKPAARDDEDDYDDRPAARGKKPARDDDFDDEDDRPAAKSKKGRDEEDDEEDDRPAKKGGKKKRAPEEDLPDTLWEDCELLRHDVLMSKLAFSFWGSSYTLSNPESEEEVGLAKEHLPVWKGALRPLNLGPVRFRDWMATVIEVRESADGPVLFTVRKRANPWPWQLTSTIEVLDFRKKLIGSFK